MKKIIYSLKKGTVLLVFITIFTSPASAQQVYKTIEGDVVLSGVCNKEKIILLSNNLFARINYQSAEIFLTLDPVTLHCASIDSINDKLANLSIGIAILNGKMNIPYVNTLKHPDHKLKFDAELQINGIIKTIIVTGLLKHVPATGNISCKLSLDFSISLKAFGIMPCGDYSEQVFVSISQTVLKPDNQ